jgi:RNA polymerase sigma-70 factor (ECF subfamily)
VFVILVIDDDGQILAYIYEKHYKNMLYTATRILGHSGGEDALQDVFVKLIKKFSNNFAELRDKPAHYFVITVRNRALDILAKQNKEAAISLDDENVFANGALASEESAFFTDDEYFTSLIRQLNPTTRRILEYKFVQEYTNKEIAEVFGVSQSVISSRIDRAKRKLKELLEDKERETDE